MVLPADNHPPQVVLSVLTRYSLIIVKLLVAPPTGLTRIPSPRYMVKLALLLKIEPTKVSVSLRLKRLYWAAPIDSDRRHRQRA